MRGNQLAKTNLVRSLRYHEKGRRVSQMNDQQARGLVVRGESLGTLVGNLGQPC